MSEASRNRRRESADLYRKAYETTHVDWKIKYCCISGFTSIFRAESVVPNKGDIEFLKSLGRDEKTSPLVRTQALFTRGLLLFASSDRERAANYYRKALLIASKASLVERSVHVIMPTAPQPIENIDPGTASTYHGNVATVSFFEPQLTGILLDEIAAVARANLDVLEAKTRILEPLPAAGDTRVCRRRAGGLRG